MLHHVDLESPVKRLRKTTASMTTYLDDAAQAYALGPFVRQCVRLSGQARWAGLGSR